MLNGLDKALSGVKGLIEGFGGLSGTLTFIGALFTTYYAKEMPTVLQNLSASFSIFTGKARAEVLELQAANNKVLEDSKRAEEGPLSSYNLQIDALKQLGTMKSNYLAVEKQLSQAEQEAYKNKLADTEATWNNIIALAKETEQLKKLNEERLKSFSNLKDNPESVLGVQGKIEQTERKLNVARANRTNFDVGSSEYEAASQLIQKYQKQLEELRTDLQLTREDIAAGLEDINQAFKKAESQNQNEQFVKPEFFKLDTSMLTDGLQKAIQELEEKKAKAEELQQAAANGQIIDSSFNGDMIFTQEQQLQGLYDQLEKLKSEPEVIARELDILFEQMNTGGEKAAQAKEKIEQFTQALIKNWQGLANSQTLYKNISKAVIEYGNSHLSSLKHLKQGTKEYDVAIKRAQEFGQTLIQSAKSAGASDEIIQKLEKSLAEIATAEDGPEAALKRFFELLTKDVGQGINITDQALKELGNTILLLNGKDSKFLDQILIGLDETTAKALRAALGLPAVGDGMEQLTQKTIPLSQALTQLSSGLMSLNTIMNSMQRIGDVFSDEDASVIEKISAVIAALTGVMMGYNMLTKGMITITQTSIGLKKKDAAATAIQTVATKGATTATGANSVAAEINASIWRSHPIVAILSVVFMVAAAAIGYFTSQTKANSEAAKKNAEVHRDSADAINEEVEANKQLIDDYNKALKVYKETNDGRKELRQKSLEIAKAYGIEDAAVKILRDDYESLTKAINEKRQAELDTASAANENAAAAQGTVLIDEITKGTGHTFGESGYTASYGGIGGNVAAWIDEQDFKIFSLDANGELMANIPDVNDISQLVKFAEEMELILAKAREYGSTATIGYKELLTEYSQGKESFDIIQNNLDTKYKNQVEATALDLFNKEEYSNISTVEDFENFRTEFFDNLIKQAEELKIDPEKFKEFGEEYLSGLEEYSELNLKAMGKEYAQQMKDDFNAKPFYDRSIEEYTENVEILNEKFSEADWSNIINQFDTLEEAVNNLKYGDTFANKKELAKKLGLEESDLDQVLEDYGEYFTQRGNQYIFTGDKQKFLNQLAEDRITKSNEGMTNAEKTNEANLDEVNHQIESAVGQLEAIRDHLKTSDQDLANKLDEAINNKDTAEIAEILNQLANSNDNFLRTAIHNIIDPNNEININDLNRDITTSEFQQVIENFMKNSEGYLQLKDQSDSSGFSSDTEKGATAQAIFDALSYMQDYQESYGVSAEEALQAYVDNYGIENTVQELFKTAGDYNIQTMTPSNFLNLLEAYLPGIKDSIPNTFQQLEESAKHWSETATNLDEYYTEKERLENEDYYDELKEKAQNVQDIKQFKDLDSRKEFSKFDEDSGKEIAKLSKQDREEILEGLYIGDLKQAGIDLESYNAEVKYLIENYGLEKEAALALAAANAKTSKGFENLTSNLKKYKEALEGTNSDTTDYQENLESFRKDLSLLLNTEVTKQFAEGIKNDTHAMDLLGKAIEGNEEAYEEFQRTVGEHLLLGVDFEEDGIDDVEQEILSVLEQAQAELPDLEVGATLDSSGLTDSFQKLLDEGYITADKLSDALSSFSMEPEIEYEEVELDNIGKQRIVNAGGLYIPNEDGGYDFKPIKAEGDINVRSTQKVYLPKINGSKTMKAPPPPVAKAGNSGKGGGGGNGGGGGDRKSKELKKVSDEIERYHKIDKTIDSLSKQYDRLSAAKDKAFGTARLKLIEQENALLQQQTEAEKARLEEVKKYYADDRSAIEAYGAVIDENGVISNYDQIMQQELDRLNAAYEEYNAGGLSDEIIEAKEKEYEEFKKILEQFEETNGEYLDQLQKVEEAIRAEITAELERIQAKIEVQLELPEHQIKMLDFKLSLLENKHFKSGERIAIWSKELEKTNEGYEVIKGSIEEILALQDENGDWSGLGLTPEQVQRLLAGDKAVLDEIKLTGENVNEIMEALLEKEDELQEKYKQMADYMKSIEEELINQLEEYNETFEKQISKMEKLQSIAQAMKDTVNTIGKEVIGVPASVMRSINNSILKSSAARANAYKVEYEAQAKNLKDAQEKLAQASEEYKDYWQDMVDTAEEAMNEAKENMLAQIQDYAEQAATILEESLAESFAEMGKNLYGMTLDDAQAAFDRYTTLSEDFLQDYQKIYELSKLTRSIEASINNTDNLKAKQALRDLQEELNEYQAEGVQMTQYEVDYLNKKYELRLAEIALEDAQNAKDQVRLSRNTDGGWGYIYTANQQNIDQAQQNYEDKLKEIQDLNYQILQETQSGILGLQKEFEDAIQEVYRKGLGKEETDRQINNLRNFYIQRAKNLGTRLDTALGNNRDVYDIWGNNKYGYGVSSPSNYMDYYSETFLGSLNPAFTSGTALTNSFINQIGDINTPGSIIGDSYQSWLDYTNNTIEMLNSIDYAGEDFAETATRWMNETSESIDDATNSVHELAQAMSEELPTAMNAVAGVQSEWGPALERAEELIVNLGEALEGLIDKMNEYNDIDLKALDIPDSSGLSNRYAAMVGSGNGGSGGSGIVGSSGNLPLTLKQQEQASQGTNYQKSVLNTVSFSTPWSSTRTTWTKSSYDVKEIKEALQSYWYQEGGWIIKWLKSQGQTVQDFYNITDINSFFRWVRNVSGVAFDTGGYTGKFGPEGKLAMLHEKELVLNQNDTLNMLKMVTLARDALGQVSIGSSLIAQTAASGYASGQTGFNSQNVSIEAHFPNVVDHNEIEQAFNNLANYAAQNAYNFDLPQRVNLF